MNYLEIYSSITFFSLILLLVITLWNSNFIDRIYKKLDQLPTKNNDGQTLVSLLIPMRNESKNVKSLLENLSQLNYKNLEILILDDNSTDNTQKLLERYKLKNIKILKGQKLPKYNWTGKNWACWQLSQHASGDYLLFIDSDVRLNQNAIEKSLQLFESFQIKMLSVFPTQILNSLGEYLTVPLMNFYLLTLLPLELVHKLPSKMFATANGQFIFIEKVIYKSIEGHKAVSSEISEDTALAKLIKTHNHKILTITDREVVSCKMYESYLEGILGFSKNFMKVLTSNIIIFFIFLIWYLGSLSSVFIIINLALIIIIRIETSLSSRQNIFINTVLYPFQLITFIIISITAILFKFGLKLSWKGRNIKS